MSGFKMCDAKKKVEENLTALAKVVDAPRYICKKCARVANRSDLLCKPMTLPQAEAPSTQLPE